MIWISLPSNWDLGVVRAVLALLINVLCFAGVWVVAYCSWKSSALKVPSHKASTRLLALFFPSGIGDIVDIFPLLRRGLGRGLLWKLISQGLLIVVLTGVAIASAPLAVSSTRLGSELKQIPVPGVRAKNSFTGISSAVIPWNNTMDRLIKADMPLDQTLDWLPDNRVDWVYQPDEWNSSWGAECEYTEETPIELFSSGNKTGDLFVEVEGVGAALGEGIRNFGGDQNQNMFWISAGSYFGSRFIDMFIWVVIQTNTSLAYNATADLRTNFLPLNFTVALIHMHGFPATDDAFFGRGPVEKASYVKTSCALDRKPGLTPEEIDPDAERFITNLWTHNLFAIVKAYSVYYEPRQALETFNNVSVTIPSPRELFRFYQAYHIIKDSQQLNAETQVSRILSVRTPTVQLAAPCLAILLAYVLAIAIATIYWVFFKKLPVGTTIPRTKVQWMMQGLKEVGGRELNAAYLDASWNQLEGDLVKARYADVNDESGRSYRTIQLGRGDSYTELDNLPTHVGMDVTVETAYFGRKSMSS
ncbi:hypothetical protein QBC34DRAFT_41711 [Podospora aff. communis PSN243]|uniref:Uncharacterized protein n=1 Tax=Podospora aff. communis PSN243 TaxID=3040156 RepID=A0AAV9GV49_9PEZI|nr:hypothetical protein QBC34DRAFT_41711 [Podospora aff. communis PSN243]